MMEYLRRHCSMVRECVKSAGINVAIMMLFELLLYAVMALCGMLWLRKLTVKMAVLQEFAPEKMLGSKEALQASMPVYRDFLFFLWGSIAFLLIMAFLGYAITRYLIWWKASGTAFSAKRMAKMAVLLIIWIAIAAVPLALAIMPIARQAAAGSQPRPGLALPLLIVAAVLFYLINTSCALFIREGRLSSLLSLPKAAVMRVRDTVMPFIMLAVLLFIITFLSAAIGAIAGQGASMVITALLALAALSLFRMHLYLVLKSNSQALC